uniref:Cytochrome P450 n=1 Tax=Heterorhabditis bacteriophora TaxID=37862 RepID=A0A1I7WFA1_HETBA
MTLFSTTINFDFNHTLCLFLISFSLNVTTITVGIWGPTIPRIPGNIWLFQNYISLQSSFHTIRMLRTVEQTMSELIATRSEQFQALEQVLAVRPLSSVLSPLFWGGVHDTILSQLI